MDAQAGAQRERAFSWHRGTLIVDDKETPQETLQNYFDDLFTGSDGELEPAQPVVAKPARPKPRLVSQSKPNAAIKPKRDFAEPDIQSAHKAKVEKLLKTAAVAPKPKVIEPVAASKPKVIEPVAAPKIKQELEVKVQPKVEVKPVEPTPVAKVAPLVETPVEIEEQVAAVEPQLDEETQLEIEGLEWAENGRPQWAQEAFDVLLFKVSGLTLAVPLVSLGQIQPITEELTPIFGQADWFMGLQPTNVGKIRTVNTALFVMPERYDSAFVETAKLVISINGLPWGLAVDSVNQPITLDPDAVKWRSERSKRAWLAGTVKEQMCALIDIPMMGKLLQESDTNTKKN